MKKNIFFTLLILLTIIGFIGFFWFQEVRYFRTKADVSQASFSVDNSYLFVTPLRAKANNQEKIRVTVFILNNQGIGVLGKRVTIGSDPNVLVEIIQSRTDQFGKAVFDISSGKQGEYYLEVKAEEERLNQTAHVTFY